MKSFKIVLVSAGMALTLGLTACSASTDAPDSSAPANAAADAVVTIATLEPDHLTSGNSAAANDIMAALWAPLVELDADGAIKYVQAESIASPDNGKTWTIKIKPGWTFHNGEALTAQSYVDGWNATAYGPNHWINSGQLANIEGYTDLNPTEGEPSTDTMSGVKAVDDTTIEVTMVKPNSQFPYELMGAPAFNPLPKAAFDDPKAFDVAPIGTGAYELAGAWEHNVQIPLKAYPDFKGDKPQIPNLIFKIYSSYDTAYTDVQGGVTDITTVKGAKLLHVKTDFAGNIFTGRAEAVTWLGFPLFDERYQNIKLRQAISLSIDREAINKALFSGYYTPADSLIATDMVGGSPHNCEYCTLDSEKAKQLLAEAGGWSGPMVIAYPGGTGNDATFEAVANQIRQNLDIPDVIAKPSSTFSEFLTNAREQKYDGPLYGHWGSPNPSPQSTLQNFFTAGGIGIFETHYDSPEMVKLMDEANSAATLDDAVAGYQKADKLAMDDMAAAPLFFEPSIYVHSDRIDNISQNGAFLDYAAITLK